MIKTHAPTRFSENGGDAFCPACGRCEAYAIATRRTWKCAACHKPSGVAGGTIFASPKMAFADLLAAIAVFANAVIATTRPTTGAGSAGPCMTRGPQGATGPTGGWALRAGMRRGALGWRRSAKAIDRPKQATSEIKAAAKTDPVRAGESVVVLAERIWPGIAHPHHQARRSLDLIRLRATEPQ